MRRIWFTLVVTVSLSLLATGAFYVALMTKYHTWDQLNLIDTALWVAVAGFSAIAAWLFLQGVKNFKPQLQRAYKLLCLGLIIFGIAQVQYPIASYIGAEFWYLGGFIALPYLAAAVFVFWGVRSLAGVIAVHSRWMSWWVVSLASLAIVPIVVFMPHARSDFPDLEIAFGNALSALDAVFMTFGIVAILRVRSILSQIYSNALLWLAIALGANVLAGVHYIVTNLLLARLDEWYWNDGMATWPFLIGAVLLIRAGYAMVRVNQAVAAQTAASEQKQTTSSQGTLPLIDIVVYMAGLASKPQSLSAPLDTLREVSARTKAGEDVSKEDRLELIKVYRTIEQYLVINEPIREFSAAELRDMVVRQFNLDTSVARQLWQDSQESGMI